MKAFLQRLHIGGGTKDKERDIQKEKFPPLRSWPPQPGDSPRQPSSPSSYTSFKPLPELVPSQLSTQLSPRPLPQIDEPSRSSSTPSSATPTPTPSRSSPSPQTRTDDLPPEPQNRAVSPRREPDSTGRSSRKTMVGSVTTTATSDPQKKVAFISPPPTPNELDRALPDAPSPNQSSSQAPLKTTLTRFQAMHGKEPRGSSASTGASSSKVDLTTSPKPNGTVKATSTRTLSPSIHKSADVASMQSLRSGTPYSQMSAGSGSRILAATSWSEVTEADLVSNIGARERTRQEVLFEIISSEERYVQELIKMKDTFIDPLLHPYSSAPSVSPLPQTPTIDYDYYRSESPLESNDHLPPIAARFMSPTPSTIQASVSRRSHKETPATMDPESPDTDDEDEGDDRLGKGYSSHKSDASKANHPRSPYRATATRTQGRHGSAAVPFPSRSHQSLPPPPRTNPLSASTQSLGRQPNSMERDRERERNYSHGQASSKSAQRTGMLKKLKRTQASDQVLGESIAPHQLPEDLRICLEVVDSGVLEGHKRLSDALKKRYDDQFPLVRSLADVFVANSDIFGGYAKYVLHLERALEQVDDALQNTNKKPKKQDAGEWQKVCRFLKKLEVDAADKGETGLAITLSKPFQRLLKYPLLFQNLLFHTDPSTFEYESTLQMVAEVETIVRSIEDEKIQKEERDKTRDVFARIEGLDKVRQLALPKPSRVLLDEKPCFPGSGQLTPSPKGNSSPPSAGAVGRGVRGKSSFKRLSDVLGTSSSGVGGKKDLWLVVFNDVVLQCQRTGTTSLPLVSSTASRTNSLPDLQGKAKYATTGRRNAHTKPRNLYKFIKIETWTIGDVTQPRQGVVSMEDVARSRTQAHQSQPRIVPLPDDDEGDAGDSDDSDKKSKMSFSYWGADKITVQKPVIKSRAPIGGTRRVPANSPSYSRESSANAKFGTRLVSDGHGSPPTRPASRRTLGTTTPTPRKPSDDGPNYAKATVTRPAWDTSTRSTMNVTPTSKRARNTSQSGPSGTSSSTRLAAPANTSKGRPSSPSSPAPSEDSGVGLYRQMIANDGLNRI